MSKVFFTYLFMFFASTVFAQRPMIFTESANTLGAARAQFGIGTEYFEKNQAPDSSFPISEIRLFTTSLHIGIAENVDFDLDWRGRLLGKFSDGSRGSDWGDLIVSTKINVMTDERAPFSLGIRTAVKLPDTDFLPYKLGSDATDFFVHVLAKKNFSRIETRLNLGLGIIGSPRNTGEQDDIYMYNAATIAPIFFSTHIFTEVYGFTGHLGDDNKLLVRFGASQNIGDFEFNLYGSARLVGNNVDYASAFEASESWSVGFFVKKNIKF